MSDYTSAWVRQNPDSRSATAKRAHLKRKYGITLEQYIEMYDRQDGRCAICGNPQSAGRALCVDHSHVTNAVRALLCDQCNHGIGKFGDDPARLRSAADYLALYA